MIADSGLTSKVVCLWVLVYAMTSGGFLSLQGQEQKTCQKGSEGEVDCWFQLGLTRAVGAEGELDKERKRALLLEAAAAFERVLELKPDRGGAANNLAQVYKDLGRDADAERLFEQAVSSGSPLRPFYRRNYGDFLTSRGAWLRAAEQYRRTLEEERGDRQAHLSLVAILARHDPDAIPEYLWFLIARGQMLWAEEVALEQLENSASAMETLLTVLIAARAEQSNLPEDLSLTRAASVLRGLTARPDIGDGALEVLRLHEGKDFEPASYWWWAKRGEPSTDAHSGLAPRQEFRYLIRSLGEAQSRAGRLNSAREYFRLAVLLTREEPDLKAFRLLLSLPSAAEDVATIDSLEQWNEDVVKGASASPADLYFYRRDLGLFYGYIKAWGEGTGPTSGIYQLSQAIKIGGIGPPDGPPDAPRFDARIYSRLAEGYADTGKPELARQTLQKLVTAYLSYSMDAEADALLAMLNSGQGRRLPPDRRREPLDDPLRLFDFTTEPPRPPQ